MRLRIMTGTLALGVLVCGDRDRSAVPRSSSGDPAATSAGTVPAGPIVEVKMTGNGKRAAFEPSVLRIESGTTVRFINVSGAAHNITFYPDSIPDGAAAPLEAGMPSQMGDLAGPFLARSNETYAVSFARSPAGTYKGYCMLHEAQGMKITIEVE